MFTKSIAHWSFVASLTLAGFFTPTTAAAQPGVLPQMTSDRDEMSVRTGGWQQLHLKGGVQQAGAAYLILGSISGTAPGIRVHDVTIPLNYDMYTEFTLTRPNAGLILNQLGGLNAEGEAQAAFFLPAGLARDFVGLEINHAYVLDGVDGSIQASNPVPLLLTD